MHLFSLLHRSGYTQLGLEVDNNPSMIYKDDKGNFSAGVILQFEISQN
jgi:hypothetical protein